MILFDAERLKHSYYGFGSYCLGLGRAIAGQAGEHTEPLGFYLPFKDFGIFGKQFTYQQIWAVNKWLFKAPKAARLYHSTRQYSPYMPSAVPIVQTIHDLNYLYEDPLSKFEYYRLKYQKGIDRAERLITISNFSKKDILSTLDTKGKKIDVIYNGINIYDGEAEEPAYKPSLPFLYAIGECNFKRNFRSLPCLLKGHDIELVISGKESGDVPAILEQAKEWGVSDRVHLTGCVSEGVKKWYLQHCLALAHPTIADGFGLPPIEAMHYGKPVFLSNRTSLPEIGGPDAFFFNSEFDKDGMREEFEAGLNRIEKDASLPDKMRARAGMFNWESAARQYWKIYEEML